MNIDAMIALPPLQSEFLTHHLHGPPGEVGLVSGNLVGILSRDGEGDAFVVATGHRYVVVNPDRFEDRCQRVETVRREAADPQRQIDLGADPHRHGRGTEQVERIVHHHVLTVPAGVHT